MKKSTKSILIAVCIILIAAVVFFILTAEKKLAEDIPEEAGTAQHAEPTSNVSRQVRESVREKTGSTETLDEVINILLIGVDNDYLAGMNDLGNADGVMLLTVNNKTEEIILTSFLRDTRVRVPNAYDTKLTTTYHKGGVPLLREVFELNFEIPVTSYVLVNYLDIVDIIDSLGGIEAELSRDEIWAMIPKINNINKLVGAEAGSNIIDVEDTGVHMMNGVQTAAYLRIRPSSTRDDVGRTIRARYVVGQIMDKLKNMSHSELIDFANAFFKEVDTDLSASELFALLDKSDELLNYKTISDRIPLDGAYTSSSDGNAYAQPDYEVNNKHLFESIYEGIH